MPVLPGELVLGWLVLRSIKGRNVVIDKKWGVPTATKDGVAVAREIELEDVYENMGVQRRLCMTTARWGAIES